MEIGLLLFLVLVALFGGDHAYSKGWGEGYSTAMNAFGKQPCGCAVLSNDHCEKCSPDLFDEEERHL